MPKFSKYLMYTYLSCLFATTTYAATLTNVETTVTNEYIHTKRHSDDKSTLLLFSSSGYRHTGYLNHAKKFIDDFLKENKLENEDILLIPFAQVLINSYEDYERKISKILVNGRIKSIHRFEDKKEAIRNTKVILVAGGNTYSLLYNLYKYDLVDTIRDQVKSGKTVYIGWSAGSTIAGKSAQTSNDMAIVMPKSVEGLKLFPYHINPHFILGKVPNQNLESREFKLEEFLHLNQNETIYCLPEGSAIKYKHGHFTIVGLSNALRMTYPRNLEELKLGELY